MSFDEFGEGTSSAWSRTCVCRKAFYQSNSYTNHIKTCAAYKKNAGTSLAEAKLCYRARKSKKGKSRALELPYDSTPSSSNSKRKRGKASSVTPSLNGDDEDDREAVSSNPR